MPSIGKDLAAIRHHLGYSIEDIRHSTKIPLDTLKSIESGSIFEQTDEIKTYVRSFVRSYGRALKLDDEVVVKALNQQETGNYNHLLLKRFPEISQKSTQQAPPVTETKPEPEPTQSKDKSDLSASVPKTEPKKEAKNPTAPPGVRNVNWADMGKKFSPAKKQSPAWLIGIVLILTILGAAAYGFYRFDLHTLFEREVTVPDQQEEPAVAQNGEGTGLSLDLTDEQPAEAEETAELDEVLYITVYAAFDQLEPVRVWSDEKPRMDPYWMEQGLAFNFEFRDTVRIRGQYSRMLLFMNGHLIDNFRNNYFNSEENAVEITRSLFETDPKWANSVPFELPGNAPPPDTVTNRPTF